MRKVKEGERGKRRERQGVKGEMDWKRGENEERGEGGERESHTRFPHKTSRHLKMFWYISYNRLFNFCISYDSTASLLQRMLPMQPLMIML